MHILIIDDDLAYAENLRKDIQRRSEGKFSVDISENEELALFKIKHLRQSKNNSYGAFLIDYLLGDGVKGLDVMKRLLDESPESQAMLFTSSDDKELGRTAIEEGAVHFFDRTNVDKKLLLLRLEECFTSNELEHIDMGLTADQLAQKVVENARGLGFERARLWLCVRDSLGQIAHVQGWKESGNVGLEGFDQLSMPLAESKRVQESLKVEGSFKLFPTQQSNQGFDSFLVRQRGHKGYRAPYAGWVAVPLRSEREVFALLFMDDADSSHLQEDIRKRRLFVRLAESSSERLGAALKIDRERRLNTLARELERNLAERGKIHDAAENLAIGLCESYPELASTQFYVLIKDSSERTVEYHRFANKRIDRRPYRLNLEASELTTKLLCDNKAEIVCLNSPGEIRNMCDLLAVKPAQLDWLVYAPLLVGRSVTGALVLTGKEDDANDGKRGEWLSILKQITREIAPGLETGRLRELAERNTTRQKTLIEARRLIDIDLVTGRPRKDILHMVLTVMSTYRGMRFNRVIFFSFDHKKNDFWMETGIGHLLQQQAFEDWDSDDGSQTDLAKYRKMREEGKGYSSLEKAIENQFSYIDSDILRKALVHPLRLSSKEAIDELPKELMAILDRAEDCALIPVLAGERKLGVVYVDNHAEKNFITRDSIDEAQDLLAYAAQAIQRHQENRENHLLLELSNRKFEKGTLRDNLKLVCDKALELTDADMAIIYPIMPDETPTDLSQKSKDAAVGSGCAESSIHRIHHENGMTVDIIQHGSLLARNVSVFDERLFHGKPLIEHDLINAEKLKGLIGVVLRNPLDNVTYGVMLLGFRREPVAAEHDLAHANTLALIAQRVVQADWYRYSDDALRSRESEISAKITNLSLKLGTSEEVLAFEAAEALRVLLGSQRIDQEARISLLRWRPATQFTKAEQYPEDFYVRCYDDWKPLSLKRDHENSPYRDNPMGGVTGCVMRTKMPQLIPDVKFYNFDNVECSYIDDTPGTRCELAAPLLSGSKNETICLGACNVESSNPGEFTQRDQEVLERFARTIVTALENLRERKNLIKVINAIQIMTAPFDLKNTLESVITAVRSVAEDVTHINIWYIDENDPNRLFLQSWGKLHETANVRPDPDGSYQRKKIPYLDKFLAQNSEQNLREQFISDGQTYWDKSDYMQSNKLLAAAHLQLSVTENEKASVVGALFLNYETEHIFSDQDKILFSALANVAAASIRDADLSIQLGSQAFISSHVIQVYELAHDLNSYIGLMRSNLKRVKESKLKIDQMRWVGKIEEQLEGMVNSLPTAVVSANGEASQLKEVDVSVIADMVALYLQGQPQKHSPKLKNLLPKNLKVRANLNLLNRVINHLTKNSLNKKNETSEISLSIDSELNDSQSVCVVFSDDGLGLSSEIEKQVLRGPIWVKGEDGFSKPSMGLLLARQYMKDMNGKLNYLGKNLYGKGAKFGLRLMVVS